MSSTVDKDALIDIYIHTHTHIYTYNTHTHNSMRLKMSSTVDKDALIAAEAQIESLKAELRAKEEQIAQKEWQMKDLVREISKTKADHEAALAQMRDMVPRVDFNKAQVCVCVCACI